MIKFVDTISSFVYVCWQCFCCWISDRHFAVYCRTKTKIKKNIFSPDRKIKTKNKKRYFLRKEKTFFWILVTNIHERRIDPIGQDAEEKYPQKAKTWKAFILLGILIRFVTNRLVRAALQSSCIATPSLWQRSGLLDVPAYASRFSTVVIGGLPHFSDRSFAPLDHWLIFLPIIHARVAFDLLPLSSQSAVFFNLVVFSSCACRPRYRPAPACAREHALSHPPGLHRRIWVELKV